MKRTLIAVAVLAAVSSSAFAHDRDKDSFVFNYTAVGEKVGVEGLVALFGCVHVSGTAGAVVQNNQNVWANVDLDPMPGSYTRGTITTKIDNSKFSITGSGSQSKSSWSSSVSASAMAQGYESASAYAYSEKNKSASSSGYKYSDQSASLGGSFQHDQQSSGGHISAGGSIGGSVSYSSDNDRNHGHDSFHAQGGLSAGYKASSYQNASSVGGKFSVDEGSGQSAKWSSNSKSGSGSRAYGEESAGYRIEASASKSSEGSKWNFSANVDKTDVSTYGSITQHIDTQKPTVMDATSGSDAGSGISGNVGINITEGVDNAQSNDVSLASVDVGNVFGNAQIFNNQSSGGDAHVKNYTFNASIGDHSLGQVSGNVGVNVASGVGNAQNNSLAASTSLVSPGSASAVAMVATDDNDQSAGMNFHGSMNGTAMLGANSLQGSQGNIGVNIAGGVGNVQHNGLAIAASSIGH
ncbi:hypothetical protein FAZ95_16000 [Trinickia violacea]|uniref:Cell wall anchor protein n=1 Tax=Trinickia violacea TaxID=2571746 RepID=A0A4P8ITX6_9BURK|nr:hypothetical protein [Trinickia violacea]QCP50524.1 hypothetical protein FAZ95_16000 [Trinickia violacea]